MTTELVLLLGIFAFVLLGAFLGDTGPRATLLRSTPRLAAHIEKQLITGAGFTRNNTAERWVAPPGPPPGETR